jgi:hypothetical protein
MKYIISAIIFMIASTASAAETGWKEAFVRGGAGERHSENFNQWEIGAVYQLKWDWNIFSNWDLKTRINTSAGFLNGQGGYTAAIFSAGPALKLDNPNTNFSFELGFSPTFMSRDSFKKVDFGGSFQITSYGAISYDISEHYVVKVRYQHMSNAATNKDNPGLNLTMLGLTYKF